MGFKTYFEHQLDVFSLYCFPHRLWPDVGGSLAATSGAPVGR